MTTNTRPNLVLFLTDDHGAWASGCYGNTELRTPALDRLAAGGTRFAQAFTPSPVCSPARACLLTGRTPSQVGIHDWLQEADPQIANRDWLHGEKTLFEYVHDAGYTTALSGKWHLGRSHETPRGVDDYLGLPGWQGDHNGDAAYVENGRLVTRHGNKTAILTDHALSFLDRLAPDQPFCLTVGYIATHSPYQRQVHDPAVTRLYEEATFRDLPPYQPHPWVKNEGMPRDPTPEQLRDGYVGYYAAVTEIDRQVGRIVRRLEELGRLGDTLIVYTSDHGCASGHHGCALGHHGFWGKGNSTRPLNMYDVSLRVPLIWRGPDVAAGQVVERCVDHYDTFMTLLDRLGITPDPVRAYPGRSYAPLWRGETAVWDDTRYGEYGDLRCIRTPEWKLVWRYPDGPHDLFHLTADPGETVSLADDPALAPVVAALKARLDHFYQRYETPAKAGLRVKDLPRHNLASEAWRDGRREAVGRR